MPRGGNTMSGNGPVVAGSSPTEPEPVQAPARLRVIWKSLWERQAGEEFTWYIAEPPKELASLVESGTIPAGAALDLGCGPGVVTAYLAGFFKPSVGLDIAYGAVAEARRLTQERGLPAEFLVGEAPILPFRDASFAFVFDRGCMQNVPQSVWPAYFEEVERLLAPGGMFQLYCSKPAREGLSFSPRRLRKRIRRALRRRKPKERNLSHEFLLGLVPPSLTTVSMEDFLFHTRGGAPRAFVRAEFRKNPSGT
jgi:SAM-dependent methyltransferase